MEFGRKKLGRYRSLLGVTEFFRASIQAKKPIILVKNETWLNYFD